MDLSQRIIEKVDQGVTDKIIAGEYAWNDLSPVTQAKLYEEAERRGKTSGDPIPLLRTLYQLTVKEDPWANLKVLKYVFQNTSREKRDDILASMRKRLHEIRNTLSRSRPEEINRYMQYQAEYYVLEAHKEVDAGNLGRAIKSYEEAISRYSTGDFPASDRIALIKKDISRLRAIQSGNQHLISQDELSSEHLRLRQEIKKRAEELKAIRNDIEAESSRRDSLSQQFNRLKQEIKEYEEQARKLELLKQQIRQNEVGLQFLMALPRAAMAPLWVEVVRLALEQGEIDPLVLQAVERLAPQFPEEAPPLLAEIAARIPGSFDIDQAAYQDCTRHWMGKIAEARRLKEEKEIQAAAQNLVEAWDAYFDALGGEPQ